MSEVAIVGAGVVGLACGAALARRGHPVTVIERGEGMGREISARNSGVIHAGIYYPPGTLKAETCVAGRELLYQRCRTWGVPHRRVGKLIVATRDSEVQRLEALRERGLENGAGTLELWDGARVTQCEPRVRAVAALWSPETGIVDNHELVASYAAELERHGGVMAFQTQVRAVDRTSAGWRVETVGRDGESATLEAEVVVNAAGLGAEEVARRSGFDVDALGWRVHPCRGDYFAVVAGLGALSDRLIYPVPGVAGLGIHVTMDLGGRFRLGPDTTYVDAPDYEVDEGKGSRFAAAVAPFLPELTADALSPDFAGVRPKLQGPGDDFRDFVIDDGAAHGAPGLFSLIGIESPGLTAAGAIAERIAAMLSG